MKKNILFLLLALVCSCSNSDNSTGSSSTSINPPTWVQGYWLREVNVDGEVTDLQGLKATSNDFYFTQLGSGNSMKTLINNTLLSGGSVVVDEMINTTEYKLNIKFNESPYPQYYFKKITSTRIQFFDTAGVGGAFFIKQ